MSISDLTFGNPTYDPVFTVSSGDEDVIRLRSKETGPLSHESLDENFTNLGNKINEILDLGIGDLNIVAGYIQASNLGISAGAGIDWSATGQISHQARQAPAVGYSTGDMSNNNRRFVQALDFDQFGHINGFQSGTLNFVGSGSVAIDQTSVSNQITISSSAYTSGSSPNFNDVQVNGKVGIGTTTPAETLHIEGGANNSSRLAVTRSDVNRTAVLAASADNPACPYVGSQTNDDFAIYTNNSAKMFIGKDGNVGIGGPADFGFEVKKSKNTWVSRIYNTGSSSSAAGLLVRSDATAAHNANVFGVYADMAYKFTVRSNGHVGIATGNTAPVTPLHVVGTATIQSNGPVLVLKDNDGGDTNAQEGYISYRDSTNTERGYVGFGSALNKDFSVRNNIGNVNLHADGEVNVHPTTFFDVHGNMRCYGQGFFNRDDDLSAPLYSLQEGDGPSAYFMGGEVGIGTTTPAYDLDVAGDINFTGTLYQNGVAFSADGGNAGTLDGIDSSQFIRSDTADTMTGMLTLKTSGESLRLDTINSSNSPLLSFYQAGIRTGFIQFNDTTNSIHIYNDVFDDYLKIGDGGNGLKWNYSGNDYTVYHSGNLNTSSFLTTSNDRNFITDSRGAERAPSYYDDRYVQWDFQRNTDTLAGGDQWSVLQTVSPWTIYSSVHRQQQLAWTGSGGLKFRYATSDSTWSGWETLYTSGNLSVSSASQKILDTAGDYGSVNVTATKNNYAGYFIFSAWGFMSRQSDWCGLFNDNDNEWGVICRRNAETELFHNGEMKLETTSTGASVTGDVMTTAGQLAVQGVGSGGLAFDINAFSSINGMWGISDANYEYSYTRVGQTVNLTFRVRPVMGTWSIDPQGYIGFTGLPFAPSNPSGTTKYVGTWTVDHVSYADSKVCTIQDGKLYLWAGSDASTVVALSSDFVGTITYDI